MDSGDTSLQGVHSLQGGHSGVLGQPGIDVSGWSHQCGLPRPCQDPHQIPFSGAGHWPSVTRTTDHSPLPESLSSPGPQDPTLSRCPLFSLCLFPLCSYLSPSLLLFPAGWYSPGISIYLSTYSLSHLTHSHVCTHDAPEPQTYLSTCVMFLTPLVQKRCLASTRQLKHFRGSLGLSLTVT